MTVLRTADAVRAFGAEAEQIGRPALARDGRWRLSPTQRLIDCGNSGTGARLLIGAASGYPISARFDGDSSLRKRPMNRIVAPLSQMGARFDTPNNRLPLTVHGGKLKGIVYRSRWRRRRLSQRCCWRGSRPKARPC